MVLIYFPSSRGRCLGGYSPFELRTRIMVLRSDLTEVPIPNLPDLSRPQRGTGRTPGTA